MFLGLGCACFLAMGAAVAPRLIFLIMWLVGERVNMAFDSWIWPLLGIIFLPYTTVMFMLVWTPVAGISGWDWMWIILGVMLDIMKWGQVANNRRSVPGYPENAY